MSTLELYRSQLLWGTRFLSDYKNELDTLYSDKNFMELMHQIQRNSHREENEYTIEQIKYVAKTTMFERKAVFDFPALKDIVDDVATKGSAKNSAYISVYLAMRIYELSGVVSGNGSVKQAKLTDETKSKAEFNEYNYRQKWAAEYRCDDGHYVRSKNEALVDNWLYHHGIAHAYEKFVFSPVTKQTFCSDFYVPKLNLYIEIWGMTTPAYEKNRQNKVDFYYQNGHNLLEITGDQVKSLDDVLSKAVTVLTKK